MKMFVIALLSKNGRTRMLFKLIRLKNEKKNIYIYKSNEEIHYKNVKF